MQSCSGSSLPLPEAPTAPAQPLAQLKSSLPQFPHPQSGGEQENAVLVGSKADAGKWRLFSEFSAALPAPPAPARARSAASHPSRRGLGPPGRCLGGRAWPLGPGGTWCRRAGGRAPPAASASARLSRDVGQAARTPLRRPSSDGPCPHPASRAPTPPPPGSPPLFLPRARWLGTPGPAPSPATPRSVPTIYTPPLPLHSRPTSARPPPRLTLAGAPRLSPPPASGSPGRGSRGSGGLWGLRPLLPLRSPGGSLRRGQRKKRGGLPTTL